MSTHYFAILVPAQSGGWSVLFPDLPVYAIHGTSVQEAITSAADFVTVWLAAARNIGHPIPAPRSYEDIRADRAWALDHDIDWSTSVVSLVQFAEDNA